MSEGSPVEQLRVVRVEIDRLTESIAGVPGCALLEMLADALDGRRSGLDRSGRIALHEWILASFAQG